MRESENNGCGWLAHVLCCAPTAVAGSLLAVKWKGRGSGQGRAEQVKGGLAQRRDAHSFL